jgi:hypothetical protein
MDGAVFGIALQRFDPVTVDGLRMPRAGVLLLRDTPLCRK